MRFTGESYRVALEEIRSFSPLPVAASQWQEWLEFYFVEWVADAPAPPEWPERTVFGIRSVTPRPHELVLDVAPSAVARLLIGVLPYRSVDATVVGVPGLRPRLTPRGLELRWPDHEAVILLAKVNDREWTAAENVILQAGEDDPEVSQPIWATHPTGWTPLERDYAFDDERHWRPGFPDAAWIDSGIIRRAGLFRHVSASALVGEHLLGEHHTDEGVRDVVEVETSWAGQPRRRVMVPIDHGDGDPSNPWAIRRRA